MTDGRSPEPDFDDPAHAGIRDLLASARVEAPIPAEVAARLETTLAGLTEDIPPAPDADRSVVPLRRRPSLAPRLLAAAAAVVVAGAGAVGLRQVISTSSGSDSKSADSTASAADSGGRTFPEAAQPTAVPSTPGWVDQLDSGGQLFSGGGSRGVPVFTTAAFAEQVTQVDLDSPGRLALTSTAPGYATDSGGTVPTPTSSALRDLSAKTTMQRQAANLSTSCAGPRIAGTRSYPVVLDDQPAVLVVTPPSGGSRVVAVWSCDGSQVLTTTTIPS